jgi:hypothetical protein
VDIARACVWTRFEGTVTTDEILANSAAMAENGDVDHARVELVDLTGVVSEDVDTAVLREIADNLKRATKIQRMAVLADRELHYGLARMFQAYASDSPVAVRVFRDRDEALAWLGLD